MLALQAALRPLRLVRLDPWVVVGLVGSRLFRRLVPHILAQGPTGEQGPGRCSVRREHNRVLALQETSLVGISTRPL